MNKFQYIICLCCFYVQYALSQYVTFQRRQEKVNLCDNSSNTFLVEHFFNFIFAEFHDNPPVCVCVQMCLDQATYCYPNGCLKRPENKKKIEEPPQVSNVQSDKSKSMNFLVNDPSNFMTEYLGKKNAIDGRPARTEKPFINDFAPNPFKDRYKTLFKYKKMPKVHLRYNLREQVKNKMDSVRIEKIDVSKTRWPVNKNLRLNDNKKFLLETKFRDKVDVSYPKFFPSMSSEEKRAQFQFQFKRDLTKKVGNTEKTKLLDETEDTTENLTFSLENLIENLIERSFDPLTNDTEMDVNIKLDYSNSNFTTSEPVTIPNKRSIFTGNTTIIINETSVVSMNMTNENINKNKYMEDFIGDETYKNVINQMIETLSKNIEKQNNSSIEFMEQYIGNQIEDTTENNSINSEVNSNTDVITKSAKSTEPITEKAELITNKANRQRLTRKLQNSKINWK